MHHFVRDATRTGWGERLTAENQVPPHVGRVLNKPPRLRAALAELAPAR